VLKRIFLFAALIGAASLVSGSALAASNQSYQHFGPRLSPPVHWNPVHKNVPPAGYFKVAAAVYDPGHINEASAEWEVGIGCIGSVSNACVTGDFEDTQNTGLYLAKSGATPDQVAAFGVVSGLPHGMSAIGPLEFGYDIRNGGHCGSGAVRFNVVTNDNITHFIGCNSPPPTSSDSELGWTRMRWGDKAGNIMPPADPAFLPGNTIVSVAIVLDEGIDTGPDFSGFAILDNIDIDGVLVGRQKCTTGPPCT
jgi:hypothetical protein